MKRGTPLLYYASFVTAFAFSALGCADDPMDAAAAGDEAREDDLTSSTAKKLGVPLEVLAATFFFEPSSIDQSGLGLVVADGVAWAKGATSQALPSTTTLDRVPFASLQSGRVELRGDGPTSGAFGAFFDYPDLVVDPAARPAPARLVGRAAPPVLPIGEMKVGLACRVLGTEMDMYASGPPKLMSLEGAVDRVKADGDPGKSYLALVKTTRSTGGEGSVLVCNGKVAGFSAGSGSQGTYHEFRSIDADLVAAFTKARDAAHADCRRYDHCR